MKTSFTKELSRLALGGFSVLFLSGCYFTRRDFSRSFAGEESGGLEVLVADVVTAPVQFPFFAAEQISKDAKEYKEKQRKAQLRQPGGEGIPVSESKD